jgi:predicted transcriptional regulator of viral defense system
MDVEELRKSIPTEEFDYQSLLRALKGYERPRDKTTALLRDGVIVRVKKGIYVFGQRYARRPFSKEVLANMIYGPSYVSLEYALHYHGLIPERVEAVTSISVGRNRRFPTPVGLFLYRTAPLKAYQVGIDQAEVDGRPFLIATPEKALCDKIYNDRGTGIRSQTEMREYLFASLRIDPESLKRLDADVVDDVGERYRSRKMRLLASIIRSSRKENHE